MVIRVWKGRTRAEDSDRYVEYLRETGIADSRNTSGNRGVLVSRRNQGDESEFLFISLWESVEAVKAFAGEDVERARYYPDDSKYLLDLTPNVDQYEAFFAEIDEAG